MVGGAGRAESVCAALVCGRALLQADGVKVGVGAVYGLFQGFALLAR